MGEKHCDSSSSSSCERSAIENDVVTMASTEQHDCVRTALHTNRTNDMYMVDVDGSESCTHHITSGNKRHTAMVESESAMLCSYHKRNCFISSSSPPSFVVKLCARFQFFSVFFCHQTTVLAHCFSVIFAEPLLVRTLISFHFAILSLFCVVAPFVALFPTDISLP